MRWFRLYLMVLSLALTLSTNANAQDKLSLNQTYRDAIRFKMSIGRTHMPLPPGEWVLTGLDEGTTDLGTPKMSAYLVRVENGVLTGIVRFGMNTDFSSGTWSRSRFCDRENVLFIEKRRNYEEDVDCWAINHQLFSSRKRVAKKQTIDYLVARKVKVPLTLISVEYRRTDRDKYVWCSYLFNPEHEGFAPPERVKWSVNDWHRDRIGSDPQKVAYIERLKSWGREWKTQVDAGFLGKLSTRQKGTIQTSGQTAR